MLKSLTEMLAHQADRRPDETFARFLKRNQLEATCTYAHAWQLATRWASLFLERGLEPGEPVLLCLPNCLDFIGAYFGAMLAGGVPATTAPPRKAKMDERATAALAQRCDLAGACFIVMTPEHAGAAALLAEAQRSELSVLTNALLPAVGLPISPDERICPLGTLQFTSGTSGTSKVVELTHAALLTQAQGIGAALAVQEGLGDSAVSWLPLFHDMGLIGFLLTPALFGCSVTFLRNEDFIVWMKAASEYRASITGGPPSAYAMCARFTKDEEVARYDLRNLRVALVGAEMISAQSLELFSTRFAPAGFRRASLVPAYGLAENGLAVTMSPLEQGTRVEEVDLNDLQTKGVARPPEKADAPIRSLVGVGVPIADTEVAIRGPDGELVGDREIGEVVVKSPSLMQGYRNNPGATSEALRDGWLWTGDLGYLADGWLYVTGRKKEVIIVGGCNYHPEELEQLVETIPGIYPGRTVAIGLEDPVRLTETVIVLAESAQSRSPAGNQLKQRIRETLTQANYPVSDVILLGYQSIGTTSSGKLRRLECKARFLAGDFFK